MPGDDALDTAVSGFPRRTLHKPYTPRELLDVVSEIVSTGASKPGPPPA